MPSVGIRLAALLASRAGVSGCGSGSARASDTHKGNTSVSQRPSTGCVDKIVAALRMAALLRRLRRRAQPNSPLRASWGDLLDDDACQAHSAPAAELVWLRLKLVGLMVSP